MGSLMNLINFKTASAVVAVVGVAACFVAEPAQAGLVRVTGNSINTSSFSFELEDNSVSNGMGLFRGAIQNFNITRPGPGESNSFFCGTNPCPTGDLTVAKLTTNSNGKVPGVGGGQGVSLDDLQTAYNSFYLTAVPINFSNDVLRYDVTFGSNPTSKLVWFTQSNDSSLINNLSGLSQFPAIGGFIALSSGGIDLSSQARFTLRNSSQPVPEPTAMAGLLGVVALGAVSLLKHNKSLKNPA